MQMPTTFTSVVSDWLLWSVCAVSLLLPATLAADDPQIPWATPEPAGDVNRFGANVQRTMSRLASSTPEKRNHVRVLFYGQSVSRNPWWQDVADDLRKRFPHADLEIENRAIGGYGGPVLINTAEFDLYPFYPDLVIFHVWGGVETGHQEKIIRRIRERTTAEILLWTSNLRWPKTVPPDGDSRHPDVLAIDAHDQAIWDLYQRLGDELHCEVADVRTGMQSFLNSTTTPAPVRRPLPGARPSTASIIRRPCSSKHGPHAFWNATLTRMSCGMKSAARKPVLTESAITRSVLFPIQGG